MTIWKPDTCQCVCDIEKQIQLIQCKTHNSFAETLAHNQSLNRKPSTTPTQRENLMKDKALEKLKPQFQRRS